MLSIDPIHLGEVCGPREMDAHHERIIKRTTSRRENSGQIVQGRVDLFTNRVLPPMLYALTVITKWVRSCRTGGCLWRP